MLTELVEVGVADGDKVDVAAPVRLIEVIGTTLGVVFLSVGAAAEKVEGWVDVKVEDDVVDKEALEGVEDEGAIVEGEVVEVDGVVVAGATVGAAEEEAGTVLWPPPAGVPAAGGCVVLVASPEYTSVGLYRAARWRWAWAGERLLLRSPCADMIMFRKICFC